MAGFKEHCEKSNELFGEDGAKWNTGERIHKPKKGKGSYDRKKNQSKKDN